jgi:hypothetical protein
MTWERLTNNSVVKYNNGSGSWSTSFFDKAVSSSEDVDIGTGDKGESGSSVVVVVVVVVLLSIFFEIDDERRELCFV